MKKFFSVFLCCFLVFNSVAVPASAVKAEEVAVFEDAEGNEVRVLSYGVAPANAAAGVLYLTSTGGSMGAGVASIASTALPVLGYLLAAGVIVYSVYGLANCVMDMFNLLSASALAELQEIEAAGAESYTLSDYPALSGELSGALDSVVSGLSVGNSFDWTSYDTFDPAIHTPAGSASPNIEFCYRLTSEPTIIAGTSISVSLVSELPFSQQVNAPSLSKALKIVNTATGVTAYLAKESFSTYFDEWSSIYFSAPAIYSDSSVGKHFVFPMARAGHSYADYYYTYHSEENTSSPSTLMYLYLEGTGNALLDNVLFLKQSISNGVATLTPAPALHPGMSDVKVQGSALSLVFGNGLVNVGATSTPALPEENKPIYLPPSVALDNANTLTQTGALTGTWDTTIDGEKVDTDVGVDTEVGFWQSILNWLDSFWDKFVAMLQAALMGLFVPSEGFFEQFIADISATFEDRMGILTYPISLVYEFCSHLLEVGEEDPIFRWPSWSYKGTEFLSAGSFNFNDILRNSTFKGLHDIYLLIVDAGIVFGLLRLAQKKYDSIINN